MRLRIGTLTLALLCVPVTASLAWTATQEVPEESDSRWEAFLGCWAPLAAGPTTTGPSQRVLCFRPLDDISVMKSTVIDGEVHDEQAISTDGTTRPVSRDGCAGAETATWSDDGRRVYVRSTLRCGDRPGQREVASVLALVGAGTLVEIQSDGGERYDVYRTLEAADYPASMGELRDFADEPTRLYGAAPLSLDAIVEAAGVLSAPVVNAMTFHLPTRLHIDADALIALDEAGVDDDVIDLVVAAAHPEKFDVVLEPYGDEAGYTDADYDPYYDSWPGSRGGFGYGGYYSPYYSPYGVHNPFGPRVRRGGTIIIIDRGDGGASSPRGIAVKGGGYTRAGPPSAGGSAGKGRSTSDGGRRSIGSSGTSGAASGGDGGDRETPTPRKARPKT